MASGFSLGLGDLKMTRSLDAIAREIRADWTHPNFAAQPYLRAMASLGGMRDSYGADPGAQIVAYFLSNASGWKGDTARRVKAELRAMLKGAR
jgi:hypothetical protein